MGVYLSEPETSKNIVEGQGNGFVFCSAQMQGWRKSMEDADIHEINLGDGNALFAVFDGHGGFEVSKYVENIFANQLTNCSDYKKKDYEKALDETFRIIDERIMSPEGTQQLRKIRNSGDYESITDQISNGTGCTANVVLITPTTYYIANAGDSRSVLCREGQAINLSFDHKPQSQQEQTRIIKAGGKIQMGRVNGGLNLTRSFGDFDYKKNPSLKYHQQMITCKPDIKKVERKPSDQFVIVGCDGIWQRFVDNSQGLIDIVSQSIKQKKSHRVIVEDLLDLLLARESLSGIGCDNMTAIIITFKK